MPMIHTPADAEQLTTRVADLKTRTPRELLAIGINSGSDYQQHRKQAWAPIMAALREWSEAIEYYGSERIPVGRNIGGALTDLDNIEDAIEWAESLDRSVPAQGGSILDMRYFRDQALKALRHRGL